jgi:hypothetical protein
MQFSYESSAVEAAGAAATTQHAGNAHKQHNSKPHVIAGSKHKPHSVCIACKTQQCASALEHEANSCIAVMVPCGATDPAPALPPVPGPSPHPSAGSTACPQSTPPLWGPGSSACRQAGTRSGAQAAATAANVTAADSTLHSNVTADTYANQTAQQQQQHQQAQEQACHTFVPTAVMSTSGTASMGFSLSSQMSWPLERPVLNTSTLRASAALLSLHEGGAHQHNQHACMREHGDTPTPNSMHTQIAASCMRPCLAACLRTAVRPAPPGASG